MATKKDRNAARDEIDAWARSMGLLSVDQMADKMVRGELDLGGLLAQVLPLAPGAPASPGRLGHPGARTPRRPPKLPEPRDELSIITVRIDVDHTKPPVWRRLELRSDMSASGLHEVIQAVMPWADGHLHRFWLGPDKNPWAGPHLVNEFDEDDDPALVAGDEADVVVDQLLRRPGDRVFYTYDFGDDWMHTIKVESVRAGRGDEPLAACTGGRRAAPLEDCGGPWSHNQIVSALTHGTALPEGMDDWLPPNYDPAAFVVDHANAALRLVGQPIDEIADRFEESGDGAVAVHEAVGELITTLPTQHAAVMRRLVEQARRGDLASEEVLVGPRRIPDAETAAAMQPWQLLLSVVGADGIKLSAAGWLSPAVVEQIRRDLGLRPRPGGGKREDLTPAVANLRASAMSLGLLRKYKGRLVRTPTGRDADGHPDRLWQAVAAGMIPKGRRGSRSIERETAVLLWLNLAAGWPAGERTLQTIVDTLAAAGWRGSDGSRLEEHDVRWIMEDLEEPALLMGPRSWAVDWADTTEGQRALARAAVFPE